MWGCGPWPVRLISTVCQQTLTLAVHSTEECQIFRRSLSEKFSSILHLQVRNIHECSSANGDFIDPGGPEDKNVLQLTEIKFAFGLVAMRCRPLTSPRLDFGASVMV